MKKQFGGGDNESNVTAKQIHTFFFVSENSI